MAQSHSSCSSPSSSSSPSSAAAAHTSYGQPSSDVNAFGQLLLNSRRIVALCGAGLSAASGLGTFRGAGGLWHNHRATSLATPEAFADDPGLVWLFYSYRRHKALGAAPNKGHEALARLAECVPDFITLTQNVDGLSQRASHPREQLKLLHGSLFDIKCFTCNYLQQDNYDDPFHPLLAIDSDEDDRLASSREQNPSPSLKKIDPEDLPHCPRCKTGLLRPGVVWFGEPLPGKVLSEIDDWMDRGKVDLIMVIGTTATVYPAAGYVHEARKRGARVAVVNMDADDLGAAEGLQDGDFLFVGDAARILPEMVRRVTGSF